MEKLLRTFLPVAFHAEHLAVVATCRSALAPRTDVVCLHLRQGEVLSADGTDALLVGICRLSHGGRELTDVQHSLVSAQYILYAPALCVTSSSIHSRSNSCCSQSVSQSV